MRKIIGALICVCAAVYVNAASADDLSLAIQSQAKIASHDRSEANQRARVEGLRQEASNIEKEVFYAFYREAKEAGVQFEVVSLSPKSEAAGVVMMNRTIESFEGGRFIINQLCVLGCEVSPYVNIKGIGPTDLSMIFDGPNKEPSGCDGYSEQSPSLVCSCRFAAFNNFLSIPCATVFDQSKRSLVTSEIVAWLNKSLALELKERARFNQ